jgi:hypothetical protein
MKVLVDFKGGSFFRRWGGKIGPVVEVIGALARFKEGSCRGGGAGVLVGSVVKLITSWFDILGLI